MISLKFTFLFIVISIYSDSIKLEIIKSFAGLPIDQGVEVIIKKSDLKFDYWESRIPLNEELNIPTWQSVIEKYIYLNRHLGKALLVIQKERVNEHNCYNLKLKLSYQNSELALLDYEDLKTNLISKGAIIEESTILGTPIIFKNGAIELNDNTLNSTFNFSLICANESYLVTLIYEVCPKD